MSRTEFALGNTMISKLWNCLVESFLCFLWKCGNHGHPLLSLMGFSFAFRFEMRLDPALEVRIGFWWMDARSGGEYAVKHRNECARLWVCKSVGVHYENTVELKFNVLFFLEFSSCLILQNDVIKYLQLRIKNDLKYDDWQLVIENSVHSYNRSVLFSSYLTLISILEKYILGWWQKNPEFYFLKLDIVC